MQSTEQSRVHKKVHKNTKGALSRSRAAFRVVSILSIFKQLLSITTLFEMRNQLYLICFSLCGFISAEERLSWFTKDAKIKKRIFVPDNLSEGKEENRVLPWVFHDNDERYKMELKCIMRGYNASNNPSNYKNARWSHPGFSASQVDSSAPPIPGNEGANPYKIWTIQITTSTADAGKKWATCEFQQGDFPLSTDFKFLIFRKYSITKYGKKDVVYKYGYGGGGFLDDKDLTQQVEDDIKRQISENYSMPASSVTRSGDGQTFSITVPNKIPTIPTQTTNVQLKCCENVCVRKRWRYSHLCVSWELRCYYCNIYHLPISTHFFPLKFNRDNQKKVEQIIKLNIAF